MRFLFWNVRRRPIVGLVAAVAREHKADVLILAESDVPDAELLEAMNLGQESVYFGELELPKRLRIYSKYGPRFMMLVEDREGICIRHLKPPLMKDVILVGVHLPSKRFQSEDDQTFGCERLANRIREAESTIGHSRTVVVGDFNVNPFEKGLVAADCLHAVMDRRIAEKGSRIVQGEGRRFFYNPMWGLLGDASPGPPGTYFYDSGKHLNYYWHMFDQVLVGADLLPSFRNEDVRISTEAGGISLVTESGKPNTNVSSDHLPVLFELDLRGGVSKCLKSQG